MLKLIIKIIVIVALVLGGIFIYSKMGDPKIISENDEVVLSCSDSDGNDIYTKGAVSYERDEPGESSRYEDPDWCDYYHAKTTPEVGLLRESWCEGNIRKQVLTTCGRGFICQDGRCVKG